MPPKSQTREVKTQKAVDALLILIAALVLFFVFYTRSRDPRSQSSDRAQVTQTAEATVK